MSTDEPDLGPDGARWTPITSSQWYEARNATAALRDVLLALDLAHDFPFLRADLNAFGHGIVDLGRTTPHAAARIADLLALALELDKARHQPDAQHTDQS
jgi:hypothetical protein